MSSPTTDHHVFFLIGAAGVGKTTAAKQVDTASPSVAVCYFDEIGVPSHEEMVAAYGSPEEWQRAKTIEWAQIIADTYLPRGDVILDTQTRPPFIHDACRQAGIDNYRIVLFDCSDEVRAERLTARGQPELETPDMENWARYLRRECAADPRCVVINTTTKPTTQCADELSILRAYNTASSHGSA